MRSNGLIPTQSKSVEHEARNGVVMCVMHHRMFDRYIFYIRWVPMVCLHIYIITLLTTFFQEKCFVLINHSRDEALEQFHGRAVRLFPDDARVPFHGAFIDHEMRVRGHWPYLPFFADRPISLPIQFQEWIVDTPGGGHGGDGVIGNIHRKGESKDDLSMTTFFKTGGDSNVIYRRFSEQQYTSSTVPQNKSPTTITFRDPIANPSELEAVMRSARQQPNWKAAQIEGESWDGTAEENISKYQRIMHPPPVQ